MASVTLLAQSAPAAPIDGASALGRAPQRLSVQTVVHAAKQPRRPIYAAFYYPEYPAWWGIGARYSPLLGLYDAADALVRRQHIQWLTFSKMDAAISSWYPDDPTDLRLRELLADTAAVGSPLKWAVYYELEQYRNPSTAELVRHLTHIRDELASSPAYLRVGGKPVVLVYNAYDNPCETSKRWAQANSQLGNLFYVSLKLELGWKSCRPQPSTWHQYGPDIPYGEEQGYAAYVTPGFWRADAESPLHARSLTTFRKNVQRLVAGDEPWRFVISFNEWPEGTSVEPSAEWGDSYLQVLAESIP